MNRLIMLLIGVQNQDLSLKALTMIVDSMIVPGGISSIDGYVCAASKILEEPGFTNFLFKPGITGT